MDVQNAEQCSPNASSPDPGACTNSSPADSPTDLESKSNSHVESSSAAPQCRKFESETGHSPVVSSSDFDLLYQGLQRQECRNPRKRRSKKKRNSVSAGCDKDFKEENVGQVCKCAASLAADCAAVCCCCPCAILHICILAFVKVPFVFAKKAFCYAKKSTPNKRKSDHQEEEDDEGGDDKKEKWRFYTPPWSCEESPRKSGQVDGSPRHDLDSEKIWSDLFAAGHMGFGGLPFERN